MNYIKQIACFFLINCCCATLFAQTDSLLKSTDSTKVEAGITFTGPVAKTIFGVASFYSKNLDGTKTATGETFKNSKLTAASNNFKLNTWVRVTNLCNDKTVVVRINDRMHKKMQKRGRVIDLSRLAASKLDFLQRGLTKVKVEEVAKGTLE